MTEIRKPLHKQFAATLHALPSLVTRAAVNRLKLSSVGKNESQGE
jgi:hypothetical protein